MLIASKRMLSLPLRAIPTTCTPPTVTSYAGIKDRTPAEAPPGYDAPQGIRILSWFRMRADPWPDT